MAGYTRLTPLETDRLLSHYNLGKPERITSLDGGQANSSIRITTDKGDFILSVCDEKNMAEIDCLTRVLAYLETVVFPTTRPVQTEAGGYLVAHGNKPVYVKEYIPGQVIKSLSNDMVRQVGAAMASLHILSPVEGMPDRFPYGLESFGDVLESGFRHPYLDWLGQKENFLEQAVDPGMPRGFIHGDIFWDNLLFSDGKLAAILDFEEACHYYRLFDLGMCAAGCCARNGSFDMEKVRALISGYQKHLEMTAAEKSQFKIFMEYAAVAASFWRFRQYNIRYPDPAKADTYKELSALADQINAMGDPEFMGIYGAY